MNRMLADDKGGGIVSVCEVCSKRVHVLFVAVHVARNNIHQPLSCVCVRACVRVRVHVCVFAYVYICIYIYIYISFYLSIHTYTHTHTHNTCIHTGDHVILVPLLLGLTKIQKKN
jgi:hypothetical protein